MASLFALIMAFCSIRSPPFLRLIFLVTIPIYPRQPPPAARLHLLCPSLEKKVDSLPLASMQGQRATLCLWRHKTSWRNAKWRPAGTRRALNGATGRRTAAIDALPSNVLEGR